MIELSNVSKIYGDSAVLKKVNLKINEPGIYCLLGRNGAGKTTLLKSIAGYQNITEGRISVNGKTEFIGVIVPDLYLGFYSEILDKLLSSYEKYGYKFIVFAGNGQPPQGSENISRNCLPIKSRE